ncbi:hypothetical protein BH18ACT9_BH18ACT9_08470 [soil metagenome]
MPLRHEPDVSAADWFTDRAEPWAQLCSLGPRGFAAYARLLHPARQGDDPQEHPEDLAGHLDSEVLRFLTGILARHTSTPEDCLFGLWDGFGDLHGSPAVAPLVFGGGRLSSHRAPPRISPAFPPEVLAGPRVRIPARDYLLFRGPLRLAGEWGAADLLPQQPRPINSPNLIWPADHAWFVATEIDSPWTGIGGTDELIGEVAGEPALGVERVDPATMRA